MEPKTYKNDGYLLSKESDEEVARLLLPALDAYLTELTNAQSDVLGIKVAGLFEFAAG